MFSTMWPRTSSPTPPLWTISLLETACRDRRRMDLATHIGQNIRHQVDCHSTYQRNSSHLDQWLVLLEKSTTCMQDRLGTSLQSSSTSDHRVIPQVLLQRQLLLGRTAWHRCCTQAHTAHSTVLPSLIGQWKDLL